MKGLAKIFIFTMAIVILASFFAIASPAKDLKKMSKTHLTRKQLIAKASEFIKNSGVKDFSEDLFSRIYVMESADKYYVKFAQKINFFPEKTNHYSDLMVFFNKDGIAASSYYNSQPNPETLRDKKPPTCFKLTPKIQEKFDFVLSAINKSPEIGHLDLKDFPEDLEMTVRERDKYYEVTAVSNQASNYKIDKKTGKIFDASHKHFADIRPTAEKYWPVVDSK